MNRDARKSWLGTALFEVVRDVFEDGFVPPQIDQRVKVKPSNQFDSTHKVDRRTHEGDWCNIYTLKPEGKLERFASDLPTKRWSYDARPKQSARRDSFFKKAF
ncbi:MAG: hypothetical protein ACKVHO_06440 [Verrucomicrobiia bacterium]